MSDAGFGWFGRTRKTSSTEPRRRRRHLGIMVLEPRIMYDGAAAATAAVAHHHHHDGSQPDPMQAGAAGGGPAVSAQTRSGGDGHWHHEAAPAEPMPHVVTWVKDPTEIVFIDSQVPDAQLLAQGAKPGVEVVMLDPNSDGVEQIANFLSRHSDPNLTTIDIVAHGADGVVQLGTTLLSSNTIGDYQTELAAIGKAMQPGGNIQIYGCDVAQDFNGDLFLEQLSQATGVKNVDASSGLVGAAALGGSWNLDVDLGGAPTANPFTDATLAAFPDVLPAATTQVFFDSWNGEDGGVQGQGNMVEQLTVSGSALVSSNTVINDGGANPYPALTYTTGFVVDTALNEYFIASYNYVTHSWTIQEGNISGGALTTLYTVPFQALNANFTPSGQPITGGTAVLLGGLALDAKTGELYFAQDAEDYVTGAVIPADTGIYQISVTGGPATLVTSTAAGLSNPAYLTLDTADNLVFFDDSILAGGGFPAVNNLDVANLTTGTVTVLESFTSSDPYFGLQGMDIDTTNHTLYLATADFANNTSASNAILSIPFSVSGSGSTATASIGAATTLYSGSNAFEPTDIVVDPQAEIFYTTGSAVYASSNDPSNPGVDAAIFEGSLSGGSALTEVFAVSTVLPAPTLNTGDAAMDTHAPQLFLSVINPPVVTAGGGTLTYDAGGTAVTVDNGVTVTDSNGIDLASATVSITTDFQAGDVLGIPAGDLTGSTVTGTNITESYNSSTGVLTLSGADTIADYQTAMREVTFSSTLAAPSASARTITFSVNDGLASGTATDTVNVHDAPVVTAGVNVTFAGGGSAVPLDAGLTVSDLSSTTLASATVSIGAGFVSGDTLNFATQNGISGNYNATTGVLTLSGTTGLGNYQTALESITYGFTANGDPTGGGTDTARTIDWVVNDGATSSATATSTLHTVHVAPTVTPSGLTASFTGGGAAVVLDSGITANDVDSGGNLSGATASIGAGFLSGDTLNFTTQNGITGSYIAATGVLTLSGSTTLADYKTALESITYSFTAGGDPTSGGTDTSRTIYWTVTDGSTSNGSSTAKTSSLTTVHAAPTVTAGASATYNAGGTAAVLDGALTVADADSGGNLHGATVSIGTGFVTGDVLSFTAQSGITASYASVTGVLTLSRTASLATYQAELDSVTFSTSATTAGSRTIDWVVSDGSTSHGSSAAATSTIAVQTGPKISGTGTTVSYTENGAAVPVDTGLTLTDASGANITGATVTISGGFVSGDALGIPAADLTGNIFNGTNITESYDASSGVLTLSGSDTAAHYQSALDAITYGFTANPATAGAARTVTYAVTDADGISNPAGATSTVDLVHIAPVVTAGVTATFTGGGAAVPLAGALTVSDVDSGGNLAGATASIGGFISGDALNFVNQNNITGSYNAAAGVLTLSGADTVANYQTALDSITYSFAANGDPTGGGTHTTRTVSWTVTDGSTNNGTSNTATSTLDTVHVAPVVTAGATATFTGGGGAVPLDGALTVVDVDSSGDLAGATVSIGGFISGDALNFVNQNNITGSYNAATGVLTLSGADTVANYQTALDSITYSFAANGDPTGGGTHTTRTVSWTVTDGSTNNGSSNIATSTLETVHVAPVVTAGGTATFTGGGAAVPLDSGLTLSDVDSSGNLAGATVSLGSGFVSGDILNFTNQSGITGGYNSATGVLILSGTTSVANYQTALDSITYSFAPVNGDPTVGGADPARTINWSVTDGSAGQGASNTATSTLDTAHAAPTLTAGGTGTFTGGGAAVPLDGGLAVSDVDSSGNLAGATVSIGSGFINGDTLNFTNQNGITGSYNAATGVLSLSGTTSVTNYQTALGSVTYTDGNGDPTGGGSDTSRTINWSVTDGVASSGTATSTLRTTHVAPTVTAGATATYYGGGTPQPLDSTLLVIDNNSGGNLVGASVQVIGFLNGDTLNFTNTAHITGSYNAATGVLTLVGTDTVADYQAALRSVTYSFAGNGDPTVGGANTQRSIYWVVNDGNTVNGTNETLPNTTSATLDNDQPSLGLNQVVVENGDFPSRGGATTTDIPLGSIRTFAGSTIPAGSAAADGQLLAINQNTPLFSILGTSFGGNGTYNFGLPNLQGTLAAGYEDGSNPNFALGESYGSNSFTLTNQNLPHRWGGNGVAFDNDQPTQTVNYIINTGGTFPTAGGIYSLGTVVPFLGDFAPSGYMEADGQLLSIAQNAALFSILGTTYGGNGTTNFALPDLNGRTIVGAGADATKSILVGTTTGQDSTTLSLSNLPIPQGGSQPISNDQPSIALTYLVSTVGVYPSSSSQLAPDQQYLGEIIAFAGSGGGLSGMLNAGWAVANGQLLPINQNSSLFQVIGTTYGGDGTNNFALPDLVGRSVAGTSANTTVSLGEQFGSDTVSIPGGDRFLPTVATSTLDIVHEPPTVTASGTAVFVQNGSAIPLDSGLTLTAPDSNGNISSATVNVAGGAFATDGDTLAAITASTGITASYAAATETLTLSGVDTVAHYQQVLDSVTFSSTVDTAGNRTIDWAVNDGVSSSAISTSTATVHDMPIVSAGATATFTGGGSAQPLDMGLTVTDGSSTTLASATVSIGAGFLSGDTLTINGTTHGTINDGANGTINYVFSGSSLTLSGTDTVADYRSALGSVKYSFTPANGDPTGGAANDTTRTISFVVNDGVASSTAATSTLDTVHVAPVVTPSGSIATFIGGGAAVPLDGALMVSDVDSNGNLAGATVSIGAGFLAGDTLTINGTASGAINDGANGTINYVFSGSSLTLSGTDTVADYQSALGSVKYSFTPANGDPTGGAANDTTRTISFVVNDGVASSTAVTSTLDAEHVAPVVTPSGSAATFIGGGAAVPLDSALMVSDVDSNGNLAGATVSIGTGFLSGDTLSFTNQNGITGSYDAAHGVLTLSGTATLANYRAALDSISFSFTAASLDPTAGGGDTTRSISWSVNDGVASSAAVTSTLDAVHAPPTVTAGNSLTFDANNLQPVILDSAIIVHDADKTTLAGAQVAITGGFVDTHDSLSFVSGNGITGNYDSATGVLTLSGVASVADYQAALASVTFSSSVQANGTRTVQWTVDDGNTQFNHSLVAQTALNVEGLSIRANVLPTAVLPPAASAFSAAFVPGSLTGPLVPPSGGFSDGFSGGHGFGYTVVHTDVALNTASDATVQIDLALATLEAPLGGDLTFVTARLANGDPLPDWLKFDPNTGSFAGLPPQGMFASLAPDQSPDSNIVTGTLPPNLDLGNDGATVAAEPETFAVEVLARDSRGDIAATIFTIDLRPHAGKQGWNMDRSLQPFGFERHTVTSTSLHHLAANEAVHDAARPFEMLASNVSPIHHDDAGSAAGNEAVPSGRAGLTEQMAAIGWRSMHAQRNALLASLQGR